MNSASGLEGSRDTLTERGQPDGEDFIGLFFSVGRLCNVPWIGMSGVGIKLDLDYIVFRVWFLKNVALEGFVEFS